MSGPYTPDQMEPARAGADALGTSLDGLRAEASAAVAQSANVLRSVRERYRAASAVAGGDPDELAARASMLARLDLAERTMSRMWLFLERGDASLVAEGVGGLGDDDAAMRVIQAQEAERARIAKEVHDGPAQALSNAIFQADHIERLATTDPAAAARELQDLRDHLRRELGNVRHFINQLRPPVLDDLGLDGAMVEAADRLRTQTGLTVMTELSAPDVELDDQQLVVALRIAQEAMQNVRKHAAASTVVVSTGMVGDTWTLEVRDDGRGFDPGAVAARGRRNFGLQFMRERAELIGARFDVVSRPDGGTVVRLSIPSVGTGAKESG